MSEYAVDGRPYFQILNTIIRHDEDQVAVDQIPEVMEWVQDNQERMQRSMTKGEWLSCAIANASR